MSPKFGSGVWAPVTHEARVSAAGPSRAGVRPLRRPAGAPLSAATIAEVGAARSEIMSGAAPDPRRTADVCAANKTAPISRPPPR